MSKTFYLKTPIRDEYLLDVRIGDIVYVTGTIATARDAVHMRVVREGVPLPISIKGLAVFHAGPVMRQTREGKWEVVSIGPTTSARMEPLEAEFIEKTGVKVIIGKGFMGSKTAEACKKFRSIVTMFPGGCGALGAECVKEVKGVYWLEDFGIPEAIWVLEVENFGPLMVTIDSTGRNYSEDMLNNAKAKREVY